MTVSKKPSFSFVAGLLACTVITLGGCGLNREPPPRYNTVVGEKRPPVLNPNGQGIAGLPVASAPPYPIPPGPPPYPTGNENIPEDSVSVVPQPYTPQTMAGMKEPRHLSPYDVPPPQQEEKGWFSGLWGDDNASAEKIDSMPRKPLPGNSREMVEQDMRAAPVADVAASDMSMDMTPMSEAPMETIPPMMTDGQGYPVLAETPPVPEASDARLEAARERLRAMEAQRRFADSARQQQEAFDAEMAPSAPAPMPETHAMEAPASDWHPVGEPMPEMAPPPPPPPAMAMYGAPEQGAMDWQPGAPGMAPQPAPGMMPPPPPAYAEPVEVMQDVAASSMTPEDSLPPIMLTPPPAVAAEANPAMRVRSGYSYIPPSRYERRRETQRLSPFRQQ